MSASLHRSAHGRRPRGAGVPRGLKVLDGLALGLILAAMLAGTVFFGAVRFWMSGGLIVAVCLAMALFFARPLFYKDIRRVHVPPGFLFGVLFLVYAGIRIPFSASPYEARIEWIALFSCIGAYAVVSDVAGAGRRWKVSLGLLLVLLTLVAWYMIVQHANESRMVLMFERPEGYGMRASGTYHCPNHVAQVLALGMTLGLALALAPGAGTPLRLLGGYALLLPVYPLVLTHSRAGWIGAAGGLAVTGLLLAWRKGIRAVLIAVPVIVLLVGASGWALWTLSPATRERIERAIQVQDVRPELWRNTVELIRERPLFGHGGNNYRYVQGVHQTYSATHRARYAHNEFLHLAADYGLVGFALFALFLGVGAARILSRIRRMKRDRDAALAAGLLGALAGMLAHNFFDFTFHLYANALMLAVVAGTVVAVLFGSDELTPVYPPNRVRRSGAALLGLASLGVAGWTALSVAAALYVLPAARAHEHMQDRHAEMLYRRAMRLDPGNWEPYLELAGILREQSFWNPVPERKRELATEAEALYRRCLEVNPWQTEARYGLSLLYNAAGEHEKALEELLEIVRKSPRHAFYHTVIGRQLRLMGRDEEALQAFQTALTLDHRDAVARANIQSLRRRGVR